MNPCTYNTGTEDCEGCKGCVGFFSPRKKYKPDGVAHRDMMIKLITGRHNAMTKTEIMKHLEMSEGGAEKILRELGAKSESVKLPYCQARKRYWIEAKG